MGKEFLTAAAPRDANGGRFGLTRTVKLCTSLITGDLPSVTWGLYHSPALVKNSSNFKLFFFFFSWFLFSPSYKDYLTHCGNIFAWKSHNT